MGKLARDAVAARLMTSRNAAADPGQTQTTDARGEAVRTRRITTPRPPRAIIQTPGLRGALP